jgi:23S rRNA pseudouridine1911/1915/1917 synthase
MRKPFRVIYEDNHLVIVNKAAGTIVHGDKTGDKTLEDYVKEYIKEKYEKPGAVYLGTVHRLDRPVSGLIIFARTSKALERMNELFRKRHIQKTYWAITRNKPRIKKGKLTHWLVKDQNKNIVTAYDEEVPNSKKAELEYRYIGTINKHHLIEVEPITGRSHQIRVQLAAMGCPIRGDLKYGYPKPNPDASINLHSRRAYFVHPIKKEPLLCKAPLPENAFWEEFLELETEEIKDDTMKFLH